ncbi:hypothetical protein B0J15DRAFT_275768 [Fusarium solani]|uniref:Uncharacterized protein n=1 Tax=Fusarium solani TaxID=169388 RepID=A0A9P9HMZ4_FUSSL|nr:uncharacterized protein B0J15DRAFT_275768 [Fusarium solani]KAH7260042.1 hypothetical protein B0J15DRAFT_275768 [Fusarium solani]
MAPLSLSFSPRSVSVHEGRGHRAGAAAEQGPRERARAQSGRADEAGFQLAIGWDSPIGFLILFLCPSPSLSLSLSLYRNRNRYRVRLRQHCTGRTPHSVRPLHTERALAGKPAIRLELMLLLLRCAAPLPRSYGSSTNSHLGMTHNRDSLQLRLRALAVP